jgi:hypothetical protein
MLHLHDHALNALKLHRILPVPTDKLRDSAIEAISNLPNSSYITPEPRDVRPCDQCRRDRSPF